MKKNLVLLGMMGVGKTTIGKIVAKKLRLKFFDIDKLIEKKHSMSVKEIFSAMGEKFFRDEEEKITLDSLKKKNVVIALGGGAFINSKIRDSALLNAITVWLDLDIKSLNLRLKRNYKRPLLNKENNFKIVDDLYKKRKSLYKLAHHKIDCGKLNINNIVNNVIDIYEK